MIMSILVRVFAFLVIIFFAAGCGVQASMKPSKSNKAVQKPPSQPALPVGRVDSPAPGITIFQPPGQIPNILNFTSASIPLMHLFWERVDQEGHNPVRNGVFDLCSFDQIAVPLRYWRLTETGYSRAPDPVPTDAEIAHMVALANERNNLVRTLFPQWAPIVAYVETQKLVRDAWGFVPANHTAAAYVAFAAVSATGQLVNHGRYNPKTDGVNLKGTGPLAACALIRTPEPY